MYQMNGTLLARLRSAFLDEAATERRYAYFAQTAEIEGHLEIARLFADLAETAGCAAHGHLDFLQYQVDPTTGQAIGDTALNTAAAAVGELTDATERYPGLVDEARAEGFADLAGWLTTMCALKKAHVEKLEAALDALTQQSGTGVSAPSNPGPALTDRGTP
jgi:rubrerythrin